MKKIKHSATYAVSSEVIEVSDTRSIPEGITTDNHLNWDALTSLKRNHIQPEASCDQQKLAVRICTNDID